MAIETYRRSFTPAGGTEFQYINGFEWDREASDEALDFRIPQGDTGANGEYQADSTIGPRLLTYNVKIIGTKPSDYQNKLDAFYAAHYTNKEGILRRWIQDGSTIVSDRQIACRINAITKSKETGLANGNISVSIRAGNPFYEEPTTGTPQSLTAPGTTAIVAGGNAQAALIIMLNATGTGVITLTPSATFGVDSAYSFAFNALSAGTYIIDNRAKTFTKSGVSVINTITAGGFFFIPPTSTNLVIAAPSSNLGSGNTWAARKRFIVV